MTFKQYPLYDLAEWKNGLAFRKIDFSNTGKPVIKIAELKNGITASTAFTQGEYDEAVKLKEGDMLFSWSGNPETSIDVFWYTLPDGWLNQHIFKVTPKSMVDGEYLYYLLKYLKPKFTAIASNKQTTGLGHVTVRDLKEISVFLPSLSMQQAIGSFLSALDQKIACNVGINENLQQQAAALFAQYYEQSDNIVPFTSVVQILGGGTPRTGNSLFWNGNVPFFTPKDVGSPYTLTTEKMITEDGLKHCNSRLYPINTVFVTARGTVGKIALSGVPMAMNQSCYALVGKDIDQLLVYFYALQMVQALKHKASGAVFDAITTRDFEIESIFKLSKEDSNHFLSVVRPIYQLILSNTKENQRLSILRDILIPKLMSGEIDVSTIQL